MDFYFLNYWIDVNIKDQIAKNRHKIIYCIYIGFIWVCVWMVWYDVVFSYVDFFIIIITFLF